MAGEDEADLRRGAQFVEDREILRAGDAEDVVDAFAQQAVDEGAGAGDGLDRFAFCTVHGASFACGIDAKAGC